MNYGSFYGGRRGAAFVIAKNYPDIPSMVNDFKQGNNFFEVKYDEYVLINNENRNHPDNGKLFRRGLDYNSSRQIDYFEMENNSFVSTTITAGGAIYIGTIVGPQGNAPQMELHSYKELINNYFDESEENEIQNGYIAQGTIGLEDLLPGKIDVTNEQAQYNDNIKWCCVSIRDSNNNDTLTKIGFKVPYPVIDFELDYIPAYDEQGNVINNIQTTQINNQDGQDFHPFYEKWKIPIPKGIKGDSIGKVYITSFEKKANERIFVDDENYYMYEYIISQEEEEEIQGVFKQGQQHNEETVTIDYQGEQQNDKFIQISIKQKVYKIRPTTEILVYDIYNYDEKENPEQPKKTYCIGALNQIIQDGFTIDDNGDLNIEFTDGSSIKKQGFLKSIRNITIEKETDPTDDKEKSYLNIYYNTYSKDQNEEFIQDKDSFPIKMIKDITLNQADLEIAYTDGTTTVFEKSFVGITQVTYEDNELIIRFSDGQQFKYEMAWVSDLKIEDNTIYARFNGTDEWFPLKTQMRWIDDAQYNSDENTLSFKYNDDTEATTISNVFKGIESIQANENGNLVITYNTFVKDENGNLTSQNETDTIILQGSLITDVHFDNQTHKFVIQYAGGKQPDEINVVYPSQVIFENTKPDQDEYRLKINDVTGANILTSSIIDSVYDIQVTQDHHLVLMFASPDTRSDIIARHKNYPNSLKAKDGKYYAGWLDLGNIFVGSGIFIGRNLEYSDLGLTSTATISQIRQALNQLYPNGYDLDPQALTSQDAALYEDFFKGRIITVGLSEEVKQFYGFDYTYQTVNNEDESQEEVFKGWYYLGTIDTAGYMLGCSMGTEEEFLSIGSVSDLISDEGLYFIIED